MTIAIDSARNYQETAEQLIGECLFQTLADVSYDTFPTEQYPDAEFGKGSTRFQGADDFMLTAWPNGDGMVRWSCLDVDGPSDYAAGLFRVDLICDVGIARRGRKNAGIVDPSARQTCINDLYKAREAIRKRLYVGSTGYGVMGVEDTTTISGQGASPIVGIMEVTFGKSTVKQSVGSGDSDRLGPTAWVGVLPVTISILAR